MSDRIPCEIRIGGTTSNGLATELCDVIDNSCVSLEWGGGQFGPRDISDLQKAVDGDYLCLYDDERAWGEFDDLEEFLRDHEVPYDRLTDGKYEYDPEIAKYRPGLGLSVIMTNKAGNPVVEVASLQPVLKAIDALFDYLANNDGVTDAVNGYLQGIEYLAKGALPPDVPPLEPFTIEG